jgi:diadenosine tetraphosphate (Ap4A) HIT family hydrolase
MSWDDLAAGRECPFDWPRSEPNDYWDSVDQLSISTLCLLKNQAYRGQCILIFDPRHVIRLDQLSDDEWSRYMDDLQRVIRTIVSVCTPDHLNVASEGNVIPHLHWHVVPRYKSDARWGGPIATTTIEEMAQETLAAEERAAIIEELRSSLRGA